MQNDEFVVKNDEFCIKCEEFCIENEESSIKNLHEKVNGVSMMDCLSMMLFDCVLYSLLGLYLEQVLPKQYGARRPLLL